MIQSKKKETILLLIWIQSLLAVGGSLFFSEVMGYTPCELCWIQRIFMYPLVVIYGVALYKKDLSIALPGLILSIVGIGFSIYHYMIQKLPSLSEIGAACANVPCNVQYINYFGFITIPFLAGTAFLIIILLHLYLVKVSRRA